MDIKYYKNRPRNKIMIIINLWWDKLESCHPYEKAPNSQEVCSLKSLSSKQILKRKTEKRKKGVERAHCSTLSLGFTTVLSCKGLKEQTTRNLFSWKTS
jgi:hypothetical protein